MNILSIDRVSKHIGDRSLFENLTFGIADDDRLGLIGPNGAGKTTLLRILSGDSEPDDGRVAKSTQLQIANLPQIPVFQPDLSIRQALLSPISISNKRVTEDMEREMVGILRELGMTDLDLRMDSLSGGMIKKVALAQTLALDADLLILDEPTNHLDAWTNLWLEDVLRAWKKALLVITHDRYFLENVTNRILELEDGKLYQYEGNYSYYLEKKAEREASEARTQAKQSRLLKSELEWLRRQPKARGTKQKARVDRIEDLAANQRGGQERAFAFDSSGTDSKNRILEVKGLGMSYGGRSLFSGFEHTFRSRERLGIIGPNGCGKSTFFNILMGKIEPEAGTLKKGLHTKFGYFDQTSRDLDPNAKVLEYVKKNAGEIVGRADGSMTEATRLLDYFGFSSRMQQGPIGKLSGGERRRLHLILMLMASPNFLILDEPTNDLDIQTLVLLEEFLSDFQGCVLVASHDRYFLDRVAASLLVYENGKIEPYMGTASEYLAENRARTSESESKKKSAPARQETKPETDVAPKKSGRKLTPNEIKEYREIERQIEKLETDKKSVEESLSNPSSGHEELKKLAESHAALEISLAEKWKRWEELSAIKDAAG
ncbi:MAG TPA: ABC-F family ATP-binding cassette domain-containing protein [Leptospiraceae bacterium]|nr:ABC-F family ATP-binding cassette domain-containing protein [Leptospiraceae bacterium]